MPSMTYPCPLCGKSYSPHKMSVQESQSSIGSRYIIACEPDCETRAREQDRFNVLLGMFFGFAILAIVIAILIQM